MLKPSPLYNMISLDSADTYRIKDSESGETVSMVKGRKEAKNRVDVLNGKAVLDAT